jgi:hypothetical protein
MADFKLRLSDDLAARFDAWAGSSGGRSPALRRLIDQACSGSHVRSACGGPLGARPRKLTVRLTAADGAGLDTAAAELGLTANAWTAALVRRRLTGRPTFVGRDVVSLIAIQAELRHISVDVSQMARSLNTAALEGRVPNFQSASVDELRRELRAQMATLREAFAGNLAYWDAKM